MKRGECQSEESSAIAGFAKHASKRLQIGQIGFIPMLVCGLNYLVIRWPFFRYTSCKGVKKG